MKLKIARSIAVAVIAMLTAVATTAIADPFRVYFPTRIEWVPDFPFVPSTVSGMLTFYTDARGPLGVTFFDNEDPTAGFTDLVPAPVGSYLILPGETILVSLGGWISFGTSTFPICAYGDSAIPTDPCNPNNPPMIPIATLASADFGSFSISGPVFAFDHTVRVGTWEIHSDDRMIPEPAVIALLGMGLAGLAASRRRTGDRPFDAE